MTRKPFSFGSDTEMKTLTLIGRRWFQRTYGNTYHAVEIVADGKSVARIGPCYGYGSQWEQTAAEWLDSAGLLPMRDAKGRMLPLWIVCRDAGVELTRNVSDVARERDLKF